MRATDVAAWLGAVSGVGAILWDVYKWKRRGPKLHMSANAEMILIPADPVRGKDAKYISVQVRNTGTAATTITNLCLVTYDTWWARRRGKWSSPGGVVNEPSPAQRIPFKLEIGAEWMGMAAQNDELDRKIATGNLWCEVYHSWSKQPVRARVQAASPRTSTASK